MSSRSGLNAFDRLGIVLVTLLGTLAGLLAAVPENDSRDASTLVLIVPGLIIVPVAQALSTTASTVACGIANGVAYGVALYGWYQLAGTLRSRLPQWLGFAGGWMSRALSRHRN